MGMTPEQWAKQLQREASSGFLGTSFGVLGTFFAALALAYWINERKGGK